MSKRRRWLARVLPALVVAPVLIVAPAEVAVADPPLSTYASMIEAADPVAWWRLGDLPCGEQEQSPCRAVDSGGSGRTLIESGTGSPSFELGVDGIADSSDTALLIDDSAGTYLRNCCSSVYSPAAAATVELWVDPTVLAEDGFDLVNGHGYHIYVGFNESSNEAFDRGLYVGGAFHHGTSCTNLYQNFMNAENLSAGRLHIAMTFDGEVERLYVNGVQYDSNTDDRDLCTGSTGGVRLAGSADIPTVVDELAIYDYALDSDTIEDHVDVGNLPLGRGLGNRKAAPKAGDPVNVASGNYFHPSPIGLASPAGAYGLDWSASYNSLDNGLSEDLGRGWRTNLDAHLVPSVASAPDTSDVVFVASDGWSGAFEQTATNTWDPPAGLHGTLSWDGGPDEFTLTFDTDEVWTFDADGLLIAMDDGQGQSVDITHDAGGITAVENDVAGRRLEIDDATTNHVIVTAQKCTAYTGSVCTTWADESPTRALDYTLADETLVSAEGPAGEKETYTWEISGDGHDLEDAGKITDVYQLVGASTSVQVIENHYDAKERVDEQITASDGYIFFDYGYARATPTANHTTVTHSTDDTPDSGDEIVVYEFDQYGNTVAIEDPVLQSAEQDWQGGADEPRNRDQLGLFTDRGLSDYVNIYDAEGRLVYRVSPNPVSGNVRGDVIDYATPGGAAGEAPNEGDGDIFEQFTYVGSGDVRVEAHRSPGGEWTTYAYDGGEVVPSRVAVVDTFPSPTEVFERTCVVSDDGLVTKTVEGASESDCDPLTGEVVTDFYYGSGQPGGSSVADCPTRLLCVTVVGDGTAAEAWTVNTYDDAGRVSTVTEAYGEAEATTSKFVYDAAGRVTREFDPVAWADYGDSDFDGTHYATDYGYDLAGRLLWVSNPDNPYTGSSGYPSVAYTYTADDQVETERTYLNISTGTSTLTRNVYDELGQLEQSEVADGTGDEAITTYTYGPLGRLETQTTASGTADAVTTAFFYDLDGNQIYQTVDPDNGSGAAELSITTATAYDRAGRVACTATEAGWVVDGSDPQISCDGTGNTIAMTATGGTWDLWLQTGTSHVEVAGLARNVSTTALKELLDDHVATVTVTGTAGSSYDIDWGDDLHRRVSVDVGALTGGTATAAAESDLDVVNIYDDAGRLVEEIRSPGWPEQSTTVSVLDDAGRLHQTKAETGVLGDTTGFRPYRFDVVSETNYDLAGRAFETIAAPADAQTFTWNPATGLTTTTVFDDAGRVGSQVTADGSADAMTTTFGYDAHGWLLTETHADGSADEYTVSYEYDDLGRTTKTTRPHGSAQTTAQVRAYTPTGQLSAETDFASTPVIDTTPTRHYEYNAVGWMTEATDALGTTTQYEYDRRGNRTRRNATQVRAADPDCEEPPDPIVITMYCIVDEWDYDDNDAMTGHTFPRDDDATSTVATSYDAAGRLESTTEPIASSVNRTAAYTYNTDGQVELVEMAVTSGATLDVTYAYDTQGRRTLAESYDGTTTLTTAMVYDAAGRLTRQDNPTGPDLTWGSAINGTPRRQQLSGPTRNFRYSHDDQGRLDQTEVEILLWGVLIYVPAAQYLYDDAGRVTREWYVSNNDYFVGFEYDDGGNMTRYTSDHDGIDIHEYELTYGADGRVASECEDEDSDLACSGGDIVGRDDYVYDKAGQLRGQGDGCELPSGVPDGDCDQTWTYDGTGNRTESTAGASTTTYFPNEANQITHADIAGGNTTSFSYNWAGDRLTRDEVDSEEDPVGSLDYTWGPTGRITDILGDSSLFGEYQQHYTDDATGSLIKAEYDNDNDNDVDDTFELVWDQTMPVPQIVDGIYQGTVHFTQGYGLRRIAQATATAGTFYSYDWTNSTIESTQFPDSPTDYTAYGEQIGLGAMAPFFGYRGEFSIGGGLHLRNRDYDPGTGAFLTRDPMDGADGAPTVANAYHYADNDPLNKTDPMGLKPTEDDELSYGGAKAEFTYANFTPQPGRGRVRIALYIPTETAGLSIRGWDINALRSHGDYRDPNPYADDSRSRAVATVDYEAGTAEFRINPSCGTGGPPDDCHSALPIVDDFGMGAYWFQDLPFVNDSNRVTMSARSNGEIYIRYAILNSDKRLAANFARINGTFDLKPVGRTGVCLDYSRDSYPAMEAYQYLDRQAPIGILRQGAAWGPTAGLFNLPFTDKKGTTCGVGAPGGGGGDSW